MKNDKPILYVFMRTDLPDHTPGKALAQCNHAGTEFVIRAGQAIEQEGRDSELAAAFEQWVDEAFTFGTCVVLGVGHEELLRLKPALEDYALLSGLTLDPTYPIRNGHEVITAPVITCGWAFARRSRSIWNYLPLY